MTDCSKGLHVYFSYLEMNGISSILSLPNTKWRYVFLWMDNSFLNQGSNRLDKYIVFIYHFTIFLQYMPVLRMRYKPISSIRVDYSKNETFRCTGKFQNETERKSDLISTWLQEMSVELKP